MSIFEEYGAFKCIILLLQTYQIIVTLFHFNNYLYVYVHYILQAVECCSTCTYTPRKLRFYTLRGVSSGCVFYRAVPAITSPDSQINVYSSKFTISMVIPCVERVYFTWWFGFAIFNLIYLCFLWQLCALTNFSGINTL